jgi:hypothetical protein
MIFLYATHFILDYARFFMKAFHLLIFILSKMILILLMIDWLDLSLEESVHSLPFLWVSRMPVRRCAFRSRSRLLPFVPWLAGTRNARTMKRVYEARWLRGYDKFCLSKKDALNEGYFFLLLVVPFQLASSNLLNSKQKIGPFYRP